MRRLIRAFAGRTYHIVGNLMSELNFLISQSKHMLWILNKNPLNEMFFFEHPNQMFKLMDKKRLTILC